MNVIKSTEESRSKMTNLNEQFRLNMQSTLEYLEDRKKKCQQEIEFLDKCIESMKSTEKLK